MRAMIRWALVASLAASAPAVAQIGQSIGGSAIPRQPAPYSATFKITTVQTLAGGTTITRESTETQARDSAGRRMNSRTENTFGSIQREFTFGNASDPVANTQSNWNSQSREARVIQLPPADAQHSGCWATDSGNWRMSQNVYRPPAVPRAPASAATPARGGGSATTGVSISPAGALSQVSTQREDLGVSTIMGVEVHGTRFTTTVPAGQMGNDRPIDTTQESWTAPGLGLELRAVRDDPRSGKTTREVQSLDLGEPPISMFQPPEGYKMVTEQTHQVDCPPRP